MRGRNGKGGQPKGLAEAKSHNVRFAPPGPALARYLAGYHAYEVRAEPGERFEEIFFPAWANIRFILAGDGWAMRYRDVTFDAIPRASLFAPTSCAGFASFGAGHMFGVGVTPLGWARLIGGDASALVDTIMPLDAVFGPGTSALQSAIDAADGDFDRCVAALENFLLRRLESTTPEPPGTAAIMASLNDPAIPSVEDAAARLDMPEWKFSRVCRRDFGFAPKRLMRRARFMRTLMALREPSDLPWTERLDAGYTDQSHFIRDAQDFLGMAPGQFLARVQPIAATSMAERTRVLGAPAQALHEVKG